MARRTRKIGESGLYHIYFKGNGNEEVFRCKDDFEKFLLFTKKYEDKMTIIAYGFDSRFGHLFVKTFSLSDVMKKLMTDYAMWFNRKYKRSGTLFGSRYKSEPIKDEFAPGVSRYIIRRGKYNSAAEYKGEGKFADPRYLLSKFDSRDDLFEFLDKPEPYTYGADSPLNTAEINEKVNEALGGKPFLSLSNIERADAVNKLLSYGLTKSAISRLTGVSRETIARCLKAEQDEMRAEINRRNAEVVLL